MEALGLSQEGDLARRHQLRLLLHPVVDRGVPADRRDFTELINRIEAAYQDGKTVVVHCRMGIGRSSLTVAALLMRLGNTLDASFDLITRARGVEVPDTIEQRRWLLVDDQFHK